MSAASVRSTVASEGITCCSSRRSEPRSPLPGGWAAAQASTRTLAVSRSSVSTTLANGRHKLLAAKILRPAQCGGMVFIISNVGVGTGIEQKPRDFDGAVFDRHVKWRVIAVPHWPFGAHGNAVGD